MMFEQLRRPFHPSKISFKPQVIKDAKCMAIAYADLRAYMERLDEVCGWDWSVVYTPWGDRIICNLTIDGVTRSSTGESDAQSERSEIGGTAAEAQAFKRAAAMFGLGRYLYAIPSLWVEYDKEKRAISAQGSARLQGMIMTHWKKHGEPLAKLEEEPFDQPEDEEHSAPAQVAPAQPAKSVDPAKPQAAQVAPADDPVVGRLSLNARDIVEQEQLQQASDAWKWAVQRGYRSNEQSARMEWAKMIGEQFAGEKITPPVLKKAIACYVILCLKAGKKEDQQPAKAA